MKLNRRKKQGFLETTASSDLAFLLIIYFIVIAGFNVNKGFLMSLPSKDSTRMVLKDDLMKFDLDGSGAYWYKGKMYDINRVELEISAIAETHPDLAVLLTVDPYAPWQQVVSFVEVAKKLSIDAFSFTMKEKPGD
jgi:biopolymer transport protein ExbD